MYSPDPSPRRDLLGLACFYLHLAVMLLILGGWAGPRAGLIGYMIFLPLVVLHWKLNRNTCILNNLENWLRLRRWPAPERNAEEGAWLRTLLRRLTGLALSRGQMDAIIYAAMAGFWLLALARLRAVF